MAKNSGKELENLGVLARILSSIHVHRDRDFGGVGILMYHSMNGLPVSPLRADPVGQRLPLGGEKAVKALLRYSRNDSVYHDGFHLLSEAGDLTHLSYYFSPAIAPNLDVPITEIFGGRFRAALYGSLLPMVIATGIVSSRYGPVLFFRGNYASLSRGDEWRTLLSDD